MEICISSALLLNSCSGLGFWKSILIWRHIQGLNLAWKYRTVFSKLIFGAILFALKLLRDFLFHSWNVQTMSNPFGLKQKTKITINFPKISKRLFLGSLIALNLKISCFFNMLSRLLRCNIAKSFSFIVPYFPKLHCNSFSIYTGVWEVITLKINLKTRENIKTREFVRLPFFWYIRN